MTKKTISLAISLLVAVISLTGVALGAGAPSSVTALTRYTPGFAGTPGKMALDAAGNLYVTDFWGKGIVKLNRDGSRAGFIATNGRPSAVAVLPDNRLVVAMAAPQPYVAFYNQLGSSPTVTGEEAGVFGTPAEAYYRPVGITVDAAGYIYVLDSGDSSGNKNGFGVITDPGTIYWGKVRVYSPAGAYLHVFGARTHASSTSTVGGEFKQPASIVYEKSSNKIVVVDTMNGRLQFFAAYNGTACVYDKSIGVTAGLTSPTVNSNPVSFANPVDVAFEYDASSVLQRMYVVERGRNEISVLDATTSLSTMLMNNGNLTIVGSTIPASGVVFNAPTAAAFAKTATGGILYVGNAANTTAANILPLAVNSGSLSVGPSLTMAALPETVQTATINLSGTVSGYAVTCKVNGADVTTTGTSTWSASNVALATGYNSIVCSSTDATGTSYVQATTYYVPALLTAPTLTIVQPGAGVYTKNATVTVSGTSDTANATVQVVNGLNSDTVTTTTNTAKAWSATINLAAGSNVITVSAWKAGTAIRTANVTVNADYTLPALVVASLDSATTNSAVQNFDGIVTEANLDSIEVNGVAVATAAKVSLGSNNTYFSAPVTLERGSNTITVTARDLAGNTATVTRTVTLAPEYPAFAVELPADNSFMAGVSTAAASGAADLLYTTVDAAGSPATPAAGLWSAASFTVDSGIKAYQFSATGDGKTVSAKRTILNNASYAQLAIANPAADLATKNASITVAGTIAAGTVDAPSIVVSGGATVTDPLYTQASGAFSWTVTFPAEGAYSIKVTTGTTTAVRNVIYDTTGPELTLQADSKPMPATITGAIEPSAKIASITATLNSVPFTVPVSVITFNPVAGGSVVWRASLASYPYDANSLVITTADPAGNQKQLSYTNLIPTGDVDNDGVVRLSDALAALRHVAGTQALTGSAFTQADVGSLIEGRAGRDGVVDITDSVLILSKSYGLMTF